MPGNQMKRFHNVFFRPPVVLLLVCVVAYLPLSSFLFSLKNDAFLYNFPNKFFFSEALRAGYLPTWNPYLNYGFPLYADPGFAWWQPITWIFGLLGYTPYSFTIEVLLYIYVSGLGMYWLGRKLGFTRITAVAIGCMFMCSGFFIGNLQHINFLTCAAFLPWLTGTWLLYQRHPSTKNLIYCSLAIYLVCTGGHPAIPIATFYFLAFLIALYYVFIIEKKAFKIYILRQLTLLAVAGLLLLPLAFSYYQLLPFYERFAPTNQADSLNVGFTLQSFISFLFPFGTIKNTTWFGTDVSMRNVYFSLAGFILFLRFLAQKNKNAVQYIFLLTGMFMLLLSLGGVAKKLLYQTVPLLQFIRTNGEFRVFVIFSCIVCLAYELDKITLKSEQTIRAIKNVFTGASVALAAIAVTTFLFSKWSDLLFIPKTSIPARLKYIIDHITFTQSIFIASISALMLCVFYIYSLQKRNRLYFIAIILADLIINAWLLLPVTGVSQTPVTKMQAIISRSPKGFPAPSLFSTTDQIHVTPDEEKLIGNWNWYGKEVNYSVKLDYPSILKSTAAFLNSPYSDSLQNKPFIFLKHNKGVLTLKRFTPKQIEVLANINGTDTLIFLQNNYPGWKAWINEKEVSISSYYGNFMQLPVDAKTKTVRFGFSAFRNLLFTGSYVWGFQKVCSCNM